MFFQRKSHSSITCRNKSLPLHSLLRHILSLMWEYTTHKLRNSSKSFYFIWIKTCTREVYPLLLTALFTDWEMAGWSALKTCWIIWLTSNPGFLDPEAIPDPWDGAAGAILTAPSCLSLVSWYPLTPAVYLEKIFLFMLFYAIWWI